MTSNDRPLIHTILIANRGEIAWRIIRSCRRMGIRSVAVYSDADRGLPYVRAADVAVSLGGNAPADTYLHQDKLIAAAHRTGAIAIHPGYGFLAENAGFARRCEAEGLVFIGPNPAAIEAMGSKSRAKAIVAGYGVPVIPGYQGGDQDEAYLLEQVEKIGYPVLLKAAAGGGGKGMRIVRQRRDVPGAIAAAKREASAAFGDDELIIEKYFPEARHVEFQIFGDRHGQVLHLLERECSLQRRYQKVIEESPSPVLSGELRARMGDAAVKVARAIDYDNAGTVEFIYTGEGEFYFLEVNTRLQVEHPVTEAITGIDLVEWQIRVAEGEGLPWRQEEITADGYALECRLYAEDARNQFLPVSGQVLHWATPSQEGLRYDAAIDSGCDISTHYDPMIAKIIAHGRNRREAIRRMDYALGNLRCLGLTTNLPFLQRLVGQEAFRNGDYDTHYIERELSLEDLYDFPEEALHQAAIAITLFRWAARRNAVSVLKALPPGWRNNFYQPQEEKLRVVEKEINVRYRYLDPGFEFLIGTQTYIVRLLASEEELLRFELDGLQIHCTVVASEHWYFVHLSGTGQLIGEALPRFPEVETEQEKGGYQSPMPGEVIKVLVEAGATVRAGQGLVVLSSMKMENTIAAAEDGIVEEIYVEQGQHVEAGVLLVRINPET